MAQENLSGRTVASYRLLERIGEGGTATVYRSETPERAQCAVKVLKPRLRSDPTAVKRFLREAEYGSRVRHDAVVATHEFGEADGLYYLALEWANGESLADFMHKTKRVSPELTAHIIQQLAGALGAAHDAGIIHRDLKPENIVYDTETRIAKLLDFGIARDAEMDPAQRLTRTGFFVGTLQYVAPEALSGELVGPPADQYSLATIAYYLLTGEHPFNGRSPRELFQQLLTEDPKPINSAGKGFRFSVEVEKAIMVGLARDPAARWSSVRKFGDSLVEAVAGGAEKEEKNTGIMGVFKGFLKK